MSKWIAASDCHDEQLYQTGRLFVRLLGYHYRINSIERHEAGYYVLHFDERADGRVYPDFLLELRPENPTLGDILTTVRRELTMTQKQMALWLDIERSALDELEHDRRKPTADERNKIRSKFNLGGEDSETNTDAT